MWKIVINSICIGISLIVAIVMFASNYIPAGLINVFACIVNTIAMILNYIEASKKQAKCLEILDDMDTLLMSHTPLDKMHPHIVSRIKQAHVEYLGLNHEKQSRIPF